MRKFHFLVLVSTTFMASEAVAGDRNLDIDVQLRQASPELEPSLRQGKLLIGQREYGLAINVYRKVLRADPDNASAYSGMAIAYDGLGRPDLARKNFELALANAPMERKHYRNLARYLSVSGQPALAEKVMRDYDIARQQQSGIVALSGPMDTAVIDSNELTALSTENLLIDAKAPDQPSLPLHNDVENSQKAIVRKSSRIAQAEAGDTGRNAGNLTKSDEGAGKDTTTDTEIVTAKAGLNNLHHVLADIYQGLGQPDLSARHRLFAEDRKRSDSATRDETKRESARRLDNWLQELAERQSSSAETGALKKAKLSPLAAASHLEENASPGAHLKRQSLGQVLLVTGTTAQKMARLQDLASSPGLQETVSASVRDIDETRTERRQYFATVRLILDSGSANLEQGHSKLSKALIMREVDLAMADLMHRRWKRLPRVDQGPSQEMQKLASQLYRFADAASEEHPILQDNRFMIRSHADINIRSRIRFGPRSICIA